MPYYAADVCPVALQTMQSILEGEWRGGDIRRRLKYGISSSRGGGRSCGGGSAEGAKTRITRGRIRAAMHKAGTRGGIQKKRGKRWGEGEGKELARRLRHNRVGVSE